MPLATTFMAIPYRVPTIGWRSDIEAVTVEACRDSSTPLRPTTS
jgi:hypothetical protein